MLHKESITNQNFQMNWVEFKFSLKTVNRILRLVLLFTCQPIFFYLRAELIYKSEERVSKVSEGRIERVSWIRYSCLFMSLVIHFEVR